ncbi:mannose-6-phosphate isomerase, class I [Cutibacterium sp. V947]|uniref:mannose-6-phosphate isomerase, class I n=1 Tax=unclassified Cutibacterium TaxID=2649671 RepID=UPI003EE2786B
MRALTGRIQHYDWGSADAIPTILGVTPDGTPWAEYWLGAHPKAPSTLPDDSALDQWLVQHPNELGAESREAFGDRLPFLLKILSASHALSIQAHPSREQAEEGFAAENEAGVPVDAPNRIFRDDWPKPEMIVALTDFDALCGFRESSSSLALLSGLGKVDGLDHLLTLLSRDDGLAEFVATALSGGDAVTSVVERVVTASRAYLSDGTDEDVRSLAHTAVDLWRDHPGDPSILVALLMNRVRLAPGQHIHLGAGTLHAYLRGTGVEIMANSDNVLRGGLTSKYIDVKALRDHAIMSPVPCVGEYPQQISPGVDLYRTEFPEFRLWSVQGGDDPITLPAVELGRIVLITEGTVVAQSNSDDLELHRGQAAWLAAGEQVTLTGQGHGFLASAGVDTDHS